MIIKGQNLPSTDEKRSAPKADALSVLWQAIHPTTTEACSSLREEFNRAVREYRLNHYTTAEEGLDNLINHLNTQQARSESDTVEEGQLTALRAAAHSVRGRVYERLNRPAGAAEAFQESVKLYDQIRERGPHDVVTPADYRDLGIALYKVGRLDEAEWIFRNAIQQGDQSAETNGYLGMILQQAGKYEEAHAFLSTAVESSPNDAAANIAYADNLVEQNQPSVAINFYLRAAFLAAQNDQWEEALNLIERSNQLAPRDTRVLSVKAEVLRFAERYDEALATIDQLLQIEPKDATALGMRGQILGALNRNAEAVDSLQRAIAENPNQAWLQAELGDILRMLNRHEEALAAFNEALRLDPDNALARQSSGACLVVLERYDDALKVLDEVLREDHKNAFAWAYKGEALRLKDQYEDALVALDHSLELEPEDAFALGTKGQVLRALNRNEEAVEVLQKTVTIDSSQSWIFAELGEALRLIKRNEEALVALDKALKLDPENHSVLGSKGAVLYALRKYPEALEVLDESLKVSADYEWACSLKGAILCELGLFSEALDTLNKVTEEEPDHVLSYTLLLKGWALENLGVEHAEEARQAYAAAREIDPSSLWAIKGLANTLYLLKKRDEAKTAYNEILERLKEIVEVDAPTMALKGWCLYRIDEFNDAMRRLVDALSLDSNLFYAQFDLALVSMESERYGLGRREYDRALELTINEYPLRRRGLLHVAIRDLATAMSNNSKLREAAEAKDALKLMQGEFDKADGDPHTEVPAS